MSILPGVHDVPKITWVSLDGTPAQKKDEKVGTPARMTLKSYEVSWGEICHARLTMSMSHP